MGRIVRIKSNKRISNSKSLGSKGRNELIDGLDNLLMFGFFVYLSVYLGNKQGTGTIDAIILRVGFAFFIVAFFAKWMLDTMNAKNKITIDKDFVEQKKDFSRFHVGIFFWFLVFTTFSFLSYFWALNGDMVVGNKNSFISILALCLIIPYAIKNRKILEKYMEIFVLSNLYAIVSLVIKLPVSEWEGRVGNAIGWHSNDLGIHLACACIVALYIANTSQRAKKFIYFSLFVLFAAVMFFTGSRQSVIMLVIGIFIYSTLMSKNTVLVLRNWFIIILLVVLLFVLFTQVEALYNIIGYRFEGLYNYITGEGEADGSSLERAFFIETAKEMFLEQPVHGFGLANFAQYLKIIGYHKSTWCHNNYFELLTGVGIIGTVIFYSFLIMITLKLIKPAIKKDGMAVMLLALMIMYFVDDYVAVNYYYIYNHLIYIFSFTFLILFKKDESVLE